MKRSIFLFALFAILCSALKSQAVYDRTFVRCLGVELDGSQTLRVIGYGRNRADAKEQAIKNAVKTVIFDGIRDGNEDCNTRPLVTEVNAKERYEEYFNIFFADGGEYKKYVSLKDTKKRSGNKKKDKLGYSYEITIRVLSSELKARLKADNVISKDQ